MPAFLIRHGYMSTCTLGTLHAGPLTLFTLEPPWDHNALDRSCIKLGDYPVQAIKSVKHGNVLALYDVPGRSDIEIHAGNFPGDTKGCILVGLTWTYQAGQFCLAQSAQALSRLLMRHQEGDIDYLTIGNFPGGE